MLNKGWISHDFPKDQRESETFGGFLNGLSGENTNTWGERSCILDAFKPFHQTHSQVPNSINVQDLNVET